MHSYVTRSYVTILKQYPGFCLDILCILILIRTMQSKPNCAPVQLPACCQQWHFSLLPGTHTLPGKQNEQFLTTSPCVLLPTPPISTTHKNTCVHAKRFQQILKTLLTTWGEKTASEESLFPTNIFPILYFPRFATMMLKNCNAEKVTTIASNSFYCSNSNGKHMVNRVNSMFIVGIGRTDGCLSWISHPDIIKYKPEIHT